MRSSSSADELQGLALGRKSVSWYPGDLYLRRWLRTLRVSKTKKTSTLKEFRAILASLVGLVVCKTSGN